MNTQKRGRSRATRRIIGPIIICLTIGLVFWLFYGLRDGLIATGVAAAIVALGIGLGFR